MNLFRPTLRLVVLAFCLAGVAAQAPQSRSGAVEGAIEYAMGVEGLDRLVGARGEIVLSTGKRLRDTEIVSVDRGENRDTISAVNCKEKNGQQRVFQAAGVTEIIVGDKSYLVVRDAARKAHVLVDATRHREAINARLKAKKAHLWPKLTAEQQAQAVNELKEYSKKVAVAYPSSKLVLHETDYFLFYSDIPSKDVAAYVTQLDQMYRKLGEMFGNALGENIFRGKAVVFAFAERGEFERFEKEFFNRDVAKSTSGKNHWKSNGDVIISFHRQKNPASFSSLLVHETAHGYLARYRSSCRVPEWLDEGLAEWIAMTVVPQCNDVEKRQQRAAEKLKQTGTLDGLLAFSGHLESWQYGAASAITQSLIRSDATKFRTMLDSIKEGTDWDQSLVQTYGITSMELVQRYGKQVGVPQLQPGSLSASQVAKNEVAKPDTQSAASGAANGSGNRAGAAGVPDAGPAVDLLELIDPNRDGVKGAWSVGENELASPVEPFARLHIPYIPPEEYVMEFKVTRKQGVDALGVGFAVGNAQGLILIDGYGSTVTGLHTLDGKKANANASTRKLRAIPPDTETTIRCVVRKTNLLVQRNGETILDWSGDFNRLSPEPKYAVPEKRVLFLAAYESEFHISQLRLRPITGEGKSLRD